MSTAALADRVASALSEETASERIAELIEEAERARSGAEEGRVLARSLALDPTAGSDAASAAKQETEDLGFEVERLDSALAALRSARGEALAREADSRRRAAYDGALAERDALVEELREAYPQLERRLADLIGRLAASDAALDRVNRALPSGGERIAGAEEVARGGFEKFGDRRGYLDLRIPSLLRLPRFAVEPRDPYAWPPTE